MVRVLSLLLLDGEKEKQSTQIRILNLLTTYINFSLGCMLNDSIMLKIEQHFLSLS